MPEDYAVFALLIPTMTNSSEQCKLLLEIWTFRCQQRCLVDFNFISTGRPVAQLDNTRRNVLVLLKPSDLWKYAWKGLKARTMKTTSKGEALIHWVTIILVHKFIPMPQALKKNKKHRQQWRTSRKNGRNCQHGSWRKSATQMRYRWSKEWGQNSTLCIVDGPLSSPEFGVGPTISNILVLRGDIAKDGSESYAVFPEQRS